VRAPLSLALAFASGSLFAQTPPITPNTPDVKVPPPVLLPEPKEVIVGRQPLTASEAVAIALKNQPTLGIARANVTSARGRVQQAESDLRPQLGASSTYNQQRVLRGQSSGGGTAGGQTSNQFTSSISVDQLLFDFGRTRDQVRQQSALERATRQALVRTEQTVALQVRQAFYNHAENLRLVAISEENVTNRQRQLAQAQARVESGLGAPADLVRAKTTLADAVISLSTARNAALTSQIALNEALGIDARTPITPAESNEAPLETETDLQRLVEAAMEHRPDIREARERVAAARFGLTAAQKGNLPRFSATANVGARGPNDPLRTQTASLGISVNWNFGDGGLTAGRVREARGQEEAARAELIQTTQFAVSDVSQAYVDVQTAQQQVETAEVQLANARELVRISEGRYQGEIGTFLEVTDAQNALFSAQRNVTQTRLEVERARARLRAAIGAL
jgi:outer membrane protein